MKLACFADLHGYLYKEFDEKSDRTGSKRLDNIVDSVLFIRDYCVREGITLVLFAGDLHHSRGKVDTVVKNVLYDAIKTFHQHGIKILMIAGNHDQYDNSDVPYNSLHEYKQLPGVYVFDTVGTAVIEAPHPMRVVHEPGNIIEIVCAPYSKNAQLVKDYIAGVEKKDIPQILLFHLGISGAFVGSGNYPMADAFKVEDLRPDLFKYILGGHFHRRQFLDDHPHALYCGAPIQHSFGDEGEDKGFYIVDTSKRWDVEFVPIPNPQFHTVQGEVSNGCEEFLSLCLDRGDYVRFLVTEDQLEQYKQIIPAGLKYKVELHKEYQEQERSPVKVGMSFEDIVRSYAGQHNPEALQEGLEILMEVQTE